MPKLLDVVRELGGMINSEEFSAALSASEPFSVDISDEEFTKIKEQSKNLLTMESAANNPDLIKMIRPKLLPELEEQEMARKKKSIYDNIEEQTATTFEKLGLDLKGKRFQDQLNEIAQYKASSDNSGVVEKYNQLQEEFGQFKEKSAKKETELMGQFESYKVDSKLLNKLQSMNLATPYKEDMIRNNILNGALNEIKKKAAISLTEDGAFKLANKENPELELFDGSKKLGIDDLISPIMQPYIAKNNPDRKQELGKGLPSTSTVEVAQGSAQASFQAAKNNGGVI